MELGCGPQFIVMSPRDGTKRRSPPLWLLNRGKFRMLSAEECRLHADECAVLVQLAEHAGDRVRLLEMAKAWLDLARKSAGSSAENALAGGSSSGGPAS